MDAASPYTLKPWLAQYGSHIPSELPEPPHASLAALADDAVRSFGGQPAFTAVTPNGMNGGLSYAQVGEMSDAFAVFLRDVLQVAAGDRVAIQMPNCLAYPVVLLGVLKAGCVAVNTNPLYTPTEMAHQFNDSGARVVVIIDLYADKLQQALPQTGVQHVVTTRISEFFPALVGPIVHAVLKYWNRQIPEHTLSATTLPQALEQARGLSNVSARARGHAQALGHGSLALLQYTGGTTGVAKGAMLTHGNLLWNLSQMRAMCNSHIDDGREVVLTALPLYHVFAFTVNFLCMFAAGAHNVLVPNPRPIGNLQRAIENYRVTWITGVNTLYNALLSEEWFTAFPPRHLKAAGGGGAAMHHAVVERFEKVTGAPLVEGYGLTETSPVVCFQPLNTPRQRDSIGIPAPMTEVRLVDERGIDVPIGAPGELMVRGPQVMQGYWQRPEASAEVLKNGWLATGDVAVMDERGTFKIVDRRKDMILVSGFNVYPNEVEDVLASLDGVMEAAVVGVPDARSGEAVVACVVKRDPALDTAAVLQHCRSVMTGYKVPSKVIFRDELPKTPVGKILRRELRDELRAAAPAAKD
jgi:long-chain acyl-CoA synthetase